MVQKARSILKSKKKMWKTPSKHFNWSFMLADTKVDSDRANIVFKFYSCIWGQLEFFIFVLPTVANNILVLLFVCLRPVIFSPN